MFVKSGLALSHVFAFCASVQGTRFQGRCPKSPVSAPYSTATTMFCCCAVDPGNVVTSEVTLLCPILTFDKILCKVGRRPPPDFMNILP